MYGVLVYVGAGLALSIALALAARFRAMTSTHPVREIKCLPKQGPELETEKQIGPHPGLQGS
jgi:hypothetical protein